MYKTSDYIAGIFVLVSLALMLWITIVLGGHQSALKEIIFGAKNTQLLIRFDQVAGLEVNHAVKVQGHKFGKVKEIKFDDKGFIIVEVKLEDKITIYEDYKIDIKDESILGGKAIYIEIGSKNKKELSNLFTDSPNVLTGTISGNLMAEGGNILSDNREDIRVIVKNIKDITQKIREISDKVNHGDGIVAKLINDKDMGDDLKKGVADLQAMIAKVKDGEGFLGKLINDDKLYREVEKIIKEAQNALEDMREQAPITTFAGTLMGAF